MGVCHTSHIAAVENRMSSIARFVAKSFIPVRFGLRAMQAFAITSVNYLAGGHHVKRVCVRGFQRVLGHYIALCGVPHEVPAVGAEWLCNSLESFGLGGANLFLNCSRHFLQALNGRSFQTHWT